MKDILNKIGDYIESLEQRIAVLETWTEKVARLEARIEELEAKITELAERPEVDPAPVVEPAACGNCARARSGIGRGTRSCC